MNAPQITILACGRFISRQIGADVYYDGGHRCIKTPMSGGGYLELVEEYQPDRGYRWQLLVAVSPTGDRQVIEH
jgi:hypothetical protein